MTNRLDEIRERHALDERHQNPKAPVPQWFNDRAYLLEEVERLRDLVWPPEGKIRPAKSPPPLPEGTGPAEVLPYEAWALAQAKLLDEVEAQDTEEGMRAKLKERFELAGQHGLTVVFESKGPESQQ